MNIGKANLTPFYLKEDLPDPSLLPVKLALRSKEHSEVPNKHFFEKFLQYNRKTSRQRRRRKTNTRNDRLLSIKRNQYDLLFLDPQLRGKDSPKAELSHERSAQTAGSRNPRMLKIGRMYELARRASLDYSLIGEARQRVKETVDHLSSKIYKRQTSTFAKVTQRRTPIHQASAI